ncbi:hypothetical protein [Nannocystis punicea]|uniref:Uncharacterized protein n=1 Tax=Nannocystis punicea TaxID=2995304 RepID=A0ABY7GXQ8_9BACT|nr:hypothetical protein [Nannocystis poenicansa]WAS91741.1 hypothetical protein O0S08_36630 [Nannocystis poenicansa]
MNDESMPLPSVFFKTGPTQGLETNPDAQRLDAPRRGGARGCGCDVGRVRHLDDSVAAGAASIAGPPKIFRRAREVRRRRGRSRPGRNPSLTDITGALGGEVDVDGRIYIVDRQLLAASLQAHTGDVRVSGDLGVCP